MYKKNISVYLLRICGHWSIRASDRKSKKSLVRRQCSLGQRVSVNRKTEYIKLILSEINKKIALTQMNFVNYYKTRMHSSRMLTVRCSGCRRPSGACIPACTGQGGSARGDLPQCMLGYTPRTESQTPVKT